MLVFLGRRHMALKSYTRKNCILQKNEPVYHLLLRHWIIQCSKMHMREKIHSTYAYRNLQPSYPKLSSISLSSHALSALIPGCFAPRRKESGTRLETQKLQVVVARYPVMKGGGTENSGGSDGEDDVGSTDGWRCRSGWLMKESAGGLGSSTSASGGSTLEAVGEEGDVLDPGPPPPPTPLPLWRMQQPCWTRPRRGNNERGDAGEADRGGSAGWATIMGEGGERGHAPRGTGQVHVQGVHGVDSMPSLMSSPPRYEPKASPPSSPMNPPPSLPLCPLSSLAPTAPLSKPRSSPEAPLPSSMWWREPDGGGGPNCIGERKCQTIFFVLPLSPPPVCILWMDCPLETYPCCYSRVVPSILHMHGHLNHRLGST
jgi:hypothetical protein